MKILKWVAGIIGSLVLLVALMYGIGALLPESHSATLSQSYSVSQNQVWDLITDHQDYANWRSDVDTVVVIDSVTWREYYSYGEVQTFRQVELDTLTYLKTEIADKNLPFGGHWEYTLTAEDVNRTKLMITENGEVYDPFVRFINTIFMDQTATMKTFLKDLENKIKN